MPVMMLSDWSKGLWTAGPASKAPQGTLTRMVNCQVQDEGTIATRYGCDTFLTLASTVDGAYVASTHFFKDVNGIIYNASGTAIGVTQGGRRLRVTAMPTYGVADDLVLFPMPSGVYMQKYYNGAVSNWGIAAIPVTPIAADGGAAGIPSGTYSYRTAFYNSATLSTSSLSGISNALAVASRQITVSNLPLVCVDSQVTHINIYRSTGSTAASNWYYLDRVVLGSTATYTDNAADIDLGDEIDYSLMSPPTCNLAGRYNNRMILLASTANPRYAYASMPSQPEVFNELYYDLVLDAGDVAQGIVQVGQYAYIWGQNNVYQFSIDQSNLIYIATLRNVPGTPNGRTIATGTQGVYYQGYDGIYLLSGFGQLDFPSAQKMSLNIDALFRSTDRGGLSLINDDSNNSATFVGGRYYFTYYGNDGLWHTVVYNESKQRWKHYTGWQYTAMPTTGAYPLVGLSATVGVQNTDGYTESGVSYTSSCGFTLGLPTTVLHAFRDFRLSATCSGTLTVELWDDQTLIYSVDLNLPVYLNGYFKHSYPLGTYCLQPEIRVSSSSPFTLRWFEVNVDEVRKQVSDYSVSAQANRSQ